jgi:hypothetical protein
VADVGQLTLVALDLADGRGFLGRRPLSLDGRLDVLESSLLAAEQGVLCVPCYLCGLLLEVVSFLLLGIHFLSLCVGDLHGVLLDEVAHAFPVAQVAGVRFVLLVEHRVAVHGTVVRPHVVHHVVLIIVLGVR